MKIDIKKNTFFLISIGAIPGALFRWQIDQIFIVNLIGCFLLGFFNSLDLTKRYKLTLGVGLCGSITSYSGWSMRLFDLLNQIYEIRQCSSLCFKALPNQNTTI